MVVAGTIGYRTDSGDRLMNYDQFFSRRDRAPVFADLERIAGRFPARSGIQRKARATS
jgi:hypothetical protein